MVLLFRRRRREWEEWRGNEKMKGTEKEKMLLALSVLLSLFILVVVVSILSLPPPCFVIERRERGKWKEDKQTNKSYKRDKENERKKEIGKHDERCHSLLTLDAVLFFFLSKHTLSYYYTFSLSISLDILHSLCRLSLL